MNFAKLAEPLHALLSQLSGKPGKRPALGQGFGQSWDATCEEAFVALKQKLISASVLGYADFSKPFFLEIDASHQGLGAVLSQEGDGHRRPVAYASCGLRPVQRNMENYSAMKLDLLRLKWAVTDKFFDYLIGTKFTIFTDNNPLNHLNTAELGATRNSLSKPHQVVSCQETSVGPKHVSMSSFPAFDISALASLQQVDSIIAAFQTYWLRGVKPSREERMQGCHRTVGLLRQWGRIVEVEGVLYRRVCDQKEGAIRQLVLPAE